MENTHHHYIIKSAHKQNNETSVNFTVQPHRFNNIRSFEIKSIIIPYTWYPINSTNNIFYIQKDGDATNRTITITEGEYSLTELKAHLKVILDASAGPAHTYTISHNANTHKITITQDSGTFIYMGTLSTANKILGFSTVDTADQIAQTGDLVYNISGTNYIEIYSNQLTKFDTRVRLSNGGGTELIAIIPVGDYTYGNIIEYTPPTSIYFDYHPHAENNIDIQLYDEDKKVLGGTTGLNGQDILLYLSFHSYNTNHPETSRRNVNII